MRKTLIIVAATLAALLVIGCGAGSGDPGIPADVAADAGIASTAPAKRAEGTVGPGTWKVGTEIKPGTYITTATRRCYWARLSNFNGDLDSIIANDNLAAGERGRITVSKSDKGVEFTGDCTWVLDRN